VAGVTGAAPPTALFKEWGNSTSEA